MGRVGRVGRVVRGVLLLLVLCGLLGIAGTATPARAQDSVTQQMLEILFPELTQMGAPTWLREGTRATYYVGSADSASAGAGFTQYDVVAKDRRHVVLSARTFFDIGGGLTANGVPPGVYAPGIGPFWIHPDVLVTAEERAGRGVSVLRGPYPIDNVQFQAVRINMQGDAGTNSWVFEEDTGMLLFYSHSLGNERGDQFIAQIRFMNLRRVRLPWRATRAPAWVREGTTLRYEGVETTQLVGSPGVAVPIATVTEHKQVESRWSWTTTTNYRQGMAFGTVDGVTGIAQLTGAAWLPAQALAAAPRRPLIDKDPMTGAETTFARERGMVVLTEEGPTWRNVLAYDGESGLMVYARNESLNGAAVFATELRLTE